jgi:hypothetical protein
MPRARGEREDRVGRFLSGQHNAEGVRHALGSHGDLDEMCRERGNITDLVDAARTGGVHLVANQACQLVFGNVPQAWLLRVSC